MVSEPRRSEIVPSSTTVDALGRHLLAHQPGEGGGLLAVEVAFQPVAHRLVQHRLQASPRKHDVECRRPAPARRSRFTSAWRSASSAACFQLSSATNSPKPLRPPRAVGTALLPVAVAHHHRHVEAHQRADVAHDLPVARARSRHAARTPPARPSPAARAGLGIAHIGVDLGQKLRLLHEGGRADRVLVAIEMAIGAWRRFGPAFRNSPDFTADTASAARSSAASESSLACA